MKKTLITGIALAIAASMAGMAHAEKPAQGGPDRRGPGLEQLDLNGDGAVSREEFEAASRDRAIKAFEKLDRNGDGSVSKEEFLAGGPDRQDKMFERLDRNGDGVLTKADRPERKRDGDRKQRGDGPREHNKRDAPPKHGD